MFLLLKLSRSQKTKVIQLYIKSDCVHLQMAQSNVFNCCFAPYSLGTGPSISSVGCALAKTTWPPGTPLLHQNPGHRCTRRELLTLRTQRVTQHTSSCSWGLTELFMQVLVTWQPRPLHWSPHRASHQHTAGVMRERCEANCNSQGWIGWWIFVQIQEKCQFGSQSRVFCSRWPRPLKIFGSNWVITYQCMARTK